MRIKMLTIYTKLNYKNVTDIYQNMYKIRKNREKTYNIRWKQKRNQKNSGKAVKTEETEEMNKRITSETKNNGNPKKTVQINEEMKRSEEK